MKKIKFNRKFYGIAAAGILSAGMASCSNELNEADFGNSSGNVAQIANINLVKNPSISAWSGSSDLSNATVTRSVESTTEYDYNFPADIIKLDDISIPSDAIVMEEDWNWYNKYQDLKGKIYIPAGETMSFALPLHFSGELYVAGTYSPQTIGNNSDAGIDIYVLPGGVLNVPNSYSLQNSTIYNAGETVIADGLGGSNQISRILNNDHLVIGSTSKWGTVMNSGISIYSQGGVVEFNSSDESGNEWWYSKTEINGNIVSDNIVKSNGKISFQSSGYRDICQLIATDLVAIADGTNIFGEIDAPSMKMDGAKITLHPDGFVNITDQIDITNSDCAIQPYNVNSKGLIKTGQLNVSNTGEAVRSIFPEGIYFNVSASNVYYNPDNVNGKEDIISRINETMVMAPACGKSSISPEDPDVEDPEDDSTDTPSDDPLVDVTYPTTSEVEVNLSINDVHGSDIEDFVSKLSIHVRYPHDVKITIPIPAQYYLDVDDLYILNKHEDGLFEYGSEHKATYNLGNKVVNLSVKYDSNGITVTTQGIDQEVFDYCVENFHDGLNFEVYNYFVGRVEVEEGVWEASDLTVDQLKEYLEDSTIKFIDADGYELSQEDCPDYFINAFGDRGSDNGVYDPDSGYSATVEDDCLVTISSNPNQRSYYGDAYKGSHLNTTEENLIYKNRLFEGPEGEHDHIFLWGENE